MLAATTPFLRDENLVEVERTFYCSCGAQFDAVVHQVFMTEPVETVCPACNRPVRFSSEGQPLSY